MSAHSFSAAVASRPVIARAPTKVARVTGVVALGGFGPNMPKEDYLKKMEAKKKLIAENKAKAAAKKGGATGGFSFGAKKAEAKAAEPKKSGFSFGKKKTAPAPEPKKKGLFGFGK